MTEWQPIETAPKDGTWILAACRWADGGEDWARILRWYEDGILFKWQRMEADALEFGADISEHVPTHWMPLPEPPK